MRGGKNVARYESAPGVFRRFCRRCGSVVSGNEVDGFVELAAGR